MQKITRATYGTPQKYVNVEHILTYLIQGNDTIKISNDFFSDPDFGIPKRLFVQYEDGIGVFYDENSDVFIKRDEKYPLAQ